MPWLIVRVADGQGAAAQADQCVSLVPGVGDSAGQFQGLLVTPLSLREVTVDPVQRPSLVERLGLTIPVADVAVDARSLLQGLGRGRVITRQPPHVPEAVECVGLAEPVAEVAELTPENVELLADYSCPGGRAAATRPVVTSGTYL